jgi:hypothetical protein
MRAPRRHHTLRRLCRALPLAAAAALVAGCATRPAPPISAVDLHAARVFKEFTVYWVGKTIDGIPLTAADNLADFHTGKGFALYYGDCGSRGSLHTGGCVLPLQVTTSRYTPHSDAPFGRQHWILVQHVPAVVYQGGRAIEIYTDLQAIDIAAATPTLASDAAAALRPFNRKPSSSFPAFPQPYYTPNPSQAELDQLAGATGLTGPTGATGATSNISPPSALEPSPLILEPAPSVNS